MRGTQRKKWGESTQSHAHTIDIKIIEINTQRFNVFSREGTNKKHHEKC